MMKISDKSKTLAVIEKATEGTILCSGGLTAILDQEIGLTKEANITCVLQPMLANSLAFGWQGLLPTLRQLKLRRKNNGNASKCITNYYNAWFS